MNEGMEFMKLLSFVEITNLLQVIVGGFLVAGSFLILGWSLFYGEATQKDGDSVTDFENKN